MMPMKDELSNELCEYLRKFGLSKRKVAQCNSSTRMYHDLGLYGEMAEDFLDDLGELHHIDFGVDFGDFEFDKFFPREFGCKNWFTMTLILFVPFVGTTLRERHDYLPLTLGMVDEAIRTKCWRLVKMNDKEW
ncbi:DUF1493 family protein [Verminephrobacter aporrectodeae subsp. tuberculatae]|nr:DUF1493 family protein [Verminephrobacter aporrectodeae subsp. tuberculatae]